MTDLVERVARAIDRADQHLFVTEQTPADDARIAKVYAPLARAAIAVVLEDMMDMLDCPGAKDVEAALEAYARQNSIPLNPKERP